MHSPIHGHCFHYACYRFVALKRQHRDLRIAVRELIVVSGCVALRVQALKDED